MEEDRAAGVDIRRRAECGLVAQQDLGRGIARLAAEAEVAPVGPARVPDAVEVYEQGLPRQEQDVVRADVQVQQPAAVEDGQRAQQPQHDLGRLPQREAPARVQRAQQALASVQGEHGVVGAPRIKGVEVPGRGLRPPGQQLQVHLVAHQEAALRLLHDCKARAGADDAPVRRAPYAALRAQGKELLYEHAVQRAPVQGVLIGRAVDDGAAAAALHGLYRIFDTAQGQPAPGLERSSHRTCPSPAAQPPPWAPENRTSSAREKLSLRNSPPQSAARA